MLEIKIFYEDGSVGYSGINATEEFAKQYYEGNYFNCGVVKDNIKKCVKIEIIK